ncbi:DHH family phosphoesterase [Haloplanus aerogenes]|uniref:Bifunctional oligoribonuclease/PAP phosphatase NrnA n=1 Tax=Haloplanus aerogenes TaxID=660522 RepID=A0A3M0DT28_9EURY|nr:DHH family phosphoesterase [Haloplanus aerogenes]AZH25515.1 bifunctional oligoribonuclease/PAP phosphatase NrnA [Haloplanus aerogenes]RMB25229.1 nanoRNase/pAp phosphatase (c-di-AMP/oligoRNAs hydrolase) [Haloplanus aerogenes]
MVRRLVLGCGRAGETVVGVVSTWGGNLRAVVPDETRIEGIEGVADVIHGDPTDPETYPDATDVVLVLGEDVERNLAAARQARESFPDALIVACGGWRGTEVASELAVVADRVVDSHRIVTDHLLDSVTGDEAERVCRLLNVLRSIDGRLAVVMHDNPDPDAIASALALVHIAETVGLDADPCYFGEISHQENRALVNLLDLDLWNVESAEELAEYAGVALVDHSRPGVNDGLDPDTEVDVVIDHHPPRAPVEARFLDLRSDVGATSTLLAKYLERLGQTPSREVATALLYGIRIDTRDFTREAVDSDFEAAAFLLPHVDESVLERVEEPSMSADVLATLAAAIRNREVRGEVLTSGVGRIRDRDVLAQAADKLLDMEGIGIAVVHGFMEETVYVSARARGTDVDLGEVLRDALGPIGSAGGHADMAGAQIPLGILGAVEEASTESLANIVDDVIAGRLFEVLENPPSAPSRDHPDDIAFEFPLADE